MLQYLLNATMIWLLSLLVFDIFLRKESYHSYNRLYLLVTLVLGIVLPLVQWQEAGILPTPDTITPVANAIDLKQAVITAGTPEESTAINLQQWLWIIYYAGVAVTSILLIKEIVVLLRYSSKGTRSKDGVWHIVETGKKHSPFSAFRYIFISSKNDYDPAELRMILTHEEQHGHALHFIDTLLLEVTKVIFWFHPLVYIFQNRLLILHEYQADSAVENEPQVYGQFLIEQSMLQSAPVLSHSFNRSPIKNRIVMLTRRSSFNAGIKRLVAIPLCIVCVFLFTENAVSKGVKKEGNKLHFNGNVFELWSPTITPDTVMVQDPVSGEMFIKVARVDSFPIKMNDREIFRVSELSRSETEDYKNTTAKEIREYFTERMKPLISKMWDGSYTIGSYLILDENGKIVYYNNVRLGSHNWKADMTDSENTLARSIEADLEKIIAKTTKKFTPVKRAGKASIMRQEELFSRTIFHIKDHQVTIEVQ